MERAVKLLSMRGYSVFELTKKLEDKGYEAAEVQDVIQRLLKNNFLNDERFAYDRIRYRITVSGWGKRRIMMELDAKQVDSVIAARKFDEYFEVEAEKSLKEQAYALLMRKYGPWHDQMEDGSASYDIRMQQRKEIEKEKNRRVQFLMRRGFSLSEALDALARSARPEDEDE